MKDSTWNGGVLIGLGILLGAAVCLAAFNGSSWTASVWAAWVQAIGSVGAILVAVYAFAMERHDDRARLAARQEDQRKYVAAAILAELKGLHSQISGRDMIAVYRKNATDLASQNPPPNWPLFRAGATSTYTSVFDGLASQLGCLPIALVDELVGIYIAIKATIDAMNNIADMSENEYPISLISTACQSTAEEIERIIGHSTKAVLALDHIRTPRNSA